MSLEPSITRAHGARNDTIDPELLARAALLDRAEATGDEERAELARELLIQDANERRLEVDPLAPDSAHVEVKANGRALAARVRALAAARRGPVSTPQPVRARTGARARSTHRTATRTAAVASAGDGPSPSDDPDPRAAIERAIVAKPVDILGGRPRGKLRSIRGGRTS